MHKKKQKYGANLIYCFSRIRFGAKGTFKYTYTLTEWAFDPEVQDAWKKISEKYDLHSNPFSDPKDIIRIFSFTDSAILMSWPLQFK